MTSTLFLSTRAPSKLVKSLHGMVHAFRFEWRHSDMLAYSIKIELFCLRSLVHGGWAGNKCHHLLTSIWTLPWMVQYLPSLECVCLQDIASTALMNGRACLTYFFSGTCLLIPMLCTLNCFLFMENTKVSSVSWFVGVVRVSVPDFSFLALCFLVCWLVH